MLTLIKFLLFGGAFWLMAAFWIESGGNPKYIWAAIIPVAYIMCLQLLRE